LADFIAEVGDCDREVIASICWNGSRSTASWRTAASTWLILLAPIGHAGHASTSGGGLTINFASERFAEMPGFSLAPQAPSIHGTVASRI
jgi:hypothetical protein